MKKNFPEAMKPKVNIQDVAKLAGVSAMTVSRVINNHPRVSEKTALKVKEAIASTDYSATPSMRKRGRPSRAYLGIHSGQVAMATIGMGGDISHNPVIERTLSGAAKKLSDSHLHLIKVNLDHNDHLPDTLDRKSIDGLIITGALPSPRLLDELKDIPIVSIYHFSNQANNIDNVKPNNQSVAKLAAEAFMKAGHHRVAFFDPSAHHQEFKERRVAFAKCMKQHQGEVELYLSSTSAKKSNISKTNTTEPDLNREHFDTLLTSFLKDKKRAKAIFCPSDLVTAFLHRRLRERGHDPADFFIVSCNNERPYLEGLFPQPKVIDIRAEAIGATAADQLLKRIADPNMPHQNLTIEPEWNVD